MFLRSSHTFSGSMTGCSGVLFDCGRARPWTFTPATIFRWPVVIAFGWHPVWRDLEHLNVAGLFPNFLAAMRQHFDNYLGLLEKEGPQLQRQLFEASCDAGDTADKLGKVSFSNWNGGNLLRTCMLPASDENEIWTEPRQRSLDSEARSERFRWGDFSFWCPARTRHGSLDFWKSEQKEGSTIQALQAHDMQEHWASVKNSPNFQSVRLYG